MNVQNETLLNPVAGDPNGYVSKGGEWAAVAWGDQYIILHNGRQVHLARTYKTARTYIQKAMKGKSVSNLDDLFKS